MEIIISGKDKKLLLRVEALARRLGLQIKGSIEDEKLGEDDKSDRLYQLMQQMAESGGIKSIKDPLAWQKEVREDRKLYGRE